MSLSWEELEKELGITLERPTAENTKIRRQTLGDEAPEVERPVEPMAMADSIESYEAEHVKVEPEIIREKPMIIVERPPIIRDIPVEKKEERKTVVEPASPVQVPVRGPMTMRNRARQGFIWSEIMGPPLAKRRR